MSDVWTILAMGAGVFALRLAGFALQGAVLPPPVSRAVGFVPVATLSALVATTLTEPAEGRPTRLVAAAVAALVVRATGRLWAGLLSGLALSWLLRLA